MSNIDALIDAMAATFRACPEGHPGTSVGRAVAERLDALDRRATDISTAPRRVPAKSRPTVTSPLKLRNGLRSLEKS